jgi:hypothetical protein
MSLNKGNNYAISSKDFKNILNYDGTNLSFKPDSNYSNTPVKVTYDRDETLSFTFNQNTLDVYLICSPDLCYAFLSTKQIPNQISLSNFKLNIDGSILAYDNKNTVKLFLDTNGTLGISNDIENTKYSFVISTFTIPLALAKDTTPDNERILQTIWNDKLVYSAVENDLNYDNDKTNTANQVPRGFFCRLGNYTASDGTARNCNYHDNRSGDGQGACIGDNGATENLGTINNKRCGYFHNFTEICIDKNVNMCSADDLDWQNWYKDNDCRLQGGAEIYSSCTYKNWNPSTKDYCAEGIGNTNALPRDSNGNIIHQTIDNRNL